MGRQEASPASEGPITLAVAIMVVLVHKSGCVQYSTAALLCLGNDCRRGHAVKRT